jgi:branched-chain amino acid transport system ATP-binding protein
MAKKPRRSSGRSGGSRSSRPRSSSEPQRWPAGVPESILRAAERSGTRAETQRANERDDARRAREEMEPREPGRPIEIAEEGWAREGAAAPAAAWSGTGVEEERDTRVVRREPRTAKPRERAQAAPVTTAPRDASAARAEPEAPHYQTAPASGDAAMVVENLRVFYGAVQALKGMSFYIRPGETVAIIGSNGAGKTTTLKTVSGVSELLKTVRGKITIFGERVESWAAHKIARLGIAHSPEGRKVFPNQTVRDNLLLGAYTRSDSEVEKDIEEQYERFPILGQRRSQPAGLMSGGEQQMLAMARALMSRPKIILLDEPSMGLAPLIVKQIFQIIEQLKGEGKTILLVEQMAFQTLGIADRAYVLETGAITMEGTGKQLLEDPRVKEAYLGA